MITQGLKMMLHSDSPLYIRPSLKPSFLSFMLGMARACNDKAQRAGYAANLLLMSDSLQWFDEYKSDGMEFELDDTGLLIAFQSKANVEGHLSHVDMFEFCGIEPVRLVGDEVQEHEPLLADSVEAALFFPKERAIDPGALVTALHQRLVELGVEIVENSPIERVEMNGGRVRSVRSANQVFSGDEYVLAAGAWTGQVSKKFGYHLPIRAGKGYCIDVEPFGLKGPVLPAEAKAAVTASLGAEWLH
jgi:D-amino-acid dehydrogenase